MLCPEAGTSQSYRDALKRQQNPNTARPTTLTKAFSGRIARGISNKFIEQMKEECKQQSILPFPAQNQFTRSIRNTATTQNNGEYLSLWAGSHVHKIKELPAEMIINQIIQEFNQASVSSKVPN